MLGHRFFKAVAKKGGNRRPGTGKNPDKKTDDRSVHKSKTAIFQVLQGRKQILQAFGYGQHVERFFRLHIGHHFTHGKNTDRHNNEVNATQQLSLAKGKARGGRKQVRTHSGDPQAKRHCQQSLGQ